MKQEAIDEIWEADDSALIEEMTRPVRMLDEADILYTRRALGRVLQILTKAFPEHAYIVVEHPEPTCPKCQSVFCDPKVDTMRDARLVNKHPEMWDRMEVNYLCDNCGFTGPKAIGQEKAAEAFESADPHAEEKSDA
jgi:hypothetical protein